MPPPTRSPAPPLDALSLMEAMPGWKPFRGDDWVFEFAGQGHRVLAEAQRGRACLHSRSHVDLTTWFPEIIAALSCWSLGRLVLEGELCMVGASGLSAHHLLHRRAIGEAVPDAQLVLKLADLLVIDGDDQRDLPWHQRRALLDVLPLDDEPALQRPRVMPADGVWLQAQAMALGVPAIVGKHRLSAYRGGRSPQWRGIACRTAPTHPLPSGN